MYGNSDDAWMEFTHQTDEPKDWGGPSPWDEPEDYLSNDDEYEDWLARHETHDTVRA